jgi:CBS domain-containing protein
MASKTPNRAGSARAARSEASLEPGCCVAEVMGTELFTLTPDTVVSSALRLASSRRIQHFLVIEDGSLTGIVCQSDLKSARESSQVAACMKSPVLCIGPDTTVEDAAEIMAQNEVGCLPVVTGAFLVGMITRDKLSNITPEETPPETDEDLLAGADEDEDQPAEDAACTACGKTEKVKQYYRAGMLPLCGDCADLLPSAEAPRGN